MHILNTNGKSYLQDIGFMPPHRPAITKHFELHNHTHSITINKYLCI